MITTELQSYIIKRQFIRNIQLIQKKKETDLAPEQTSEFTTNLLFKSNNNVEFKMELIPQLHSEIKMYPELLIEFKENFKSNVTLIAQNNMQDVSTEAIISGIIPEFKPIKLTPEFLQWKLPAIHEIVDAYLNDSAIFWLEKNRQFNVMLMFENSLIMK